MMDIFHLFALWKMTYNAQFYTNMHQLLLNTTRSKREQVEEELQRVGRREKDCRLRDMWEKVETKRGKIV